MTINPNQSPLETLTIDRWDALIYSIVKRYAGRNLSIDIDDLKQEAWHALMRACKNHDPVKAAASGVKFSTYAYMYIEGQLNRYFSNQLKAPFSFQELEEDFVPDHAVSMLEEDIANSELMSRIFKIASKEKHYGILIDHFVKGKTYREIAEELGVSHALIHLRIHAMLEKIQEQFNDDNY